MNKNLKKCLYCILAFFILLFVIILISYGSMIQAVIITTLVFMGFIACGFIVGAIYFFIGFLE